MPEATTVYVAGRSTESASIDVAAGETARWEFDIEAYDIGFKAVFTPAGGAAASACDEQKCESGLARWRGEYGPVEQAGTLELTWDNTHSMMRSKTIRYRAAAANVGPEEGGPSAQ